MLAQFTVYIPKPCIQYGLITHHLEYLISTSINLNNNLLTSKSYEKHQNNKCKNGLIT